jgi:hypothetical protein
LTCSRIRGRYILQNFSPALTIFPHNEKVLSQGGKKYEQKIRAMTESANQESVFSFPPPNKEANVQKDKSTNQ